MSYVPSYLELLNTTSDGWPEGVSNTSKKFATEQVQAGLAKYGRLSLDDAKRCIYDHMVNNDPVPDDLKGVLWDWLFAVSYRALKAANALTVFVDVSYKKRTKLEKKWVPIKISRGDVESLDFIFKNTATGGVNRERVRDLIAHLKDQVGS